MAAKYTLAVWTRVIHSGDFIYEVVYQGNSRWRVRWELFKNRNKRVRLEIVSTKKAK